VSGICLLCETISLKSAAELGFAPPLTGYSFVCRIAGGGCHDKTLKLSFKALSIYCRDGNKNDK